MRVKLLAFAVCLFAVLPQAKAAVVTDIQVNDQPDRVEIYATVTGQVKTWQGQSNTGKWMVLDIAAGYGTKTLSTALPGDLIHSVHAGWYGQKPAKTRITVSTNTKLVSDLTKSNPKMLKWTIYKKAAPTAPKAVSPKTTVRNTTSRLPDLPPVVQASKHSSAASTKGTKVVGVSVVDMPDRIEVCAKTDGKVAAWTNRAMNGRAVTLGLMADYKTKRVWQGVMNENVVHVEAGAFQSRPPVSRVIVSVMSKVPYDLDTTNDREVVLTVWKSNAARAAFMAKRVDVARVAGFVEETPISQNSESEEPSTSPIDIAASEPKTGFGNSGTTISESIVFAHPSQSDTRTVSQIETTQTNPDSEPSTNPMDAPQAIEPSVKFAATLESVATNDLSITKPASPTQSRIAETTATVEGNQPASSPIELVAIASSTGARFDQTTSSRHRISLDELVLAQPAAPHTKVAALPKVPKSQSTAQGTPVRSKVAGITEELDTTTLKPGDVIPPSADLKAADPATGKITNIKVTERESSTNTHIANRLDARRIGESQGKPSEMVRLNFVGTDINDVLKALAMNSGSNIVTATDVKGEVTVSLENVGFESALNSITKLSGYQWVREGNTYYVASSKSINSFSSNESSGDLVTMTVPFSRLRASDVQSVLTGEFPNLRVTPAGDPNKARKVILQGTTREVNGATKLLEKIVNSVSPIGGDTTFEIYYVRYASPASLAMLLSTLVPNVNIDPGVVPDEVGTLTKVSGDTSAPAGDDSGGDSGAAAGGASASGSTTGTGSDQNNDSSSGKSAGTGEQNKNTWGVSYSGLMRTLILSGRPEDIAKAKLILAKIDTPSPQVMIEAKVIDIDRNDAKKLGFLYDQSDNGFNFGLSGRGHNTTTTRDFDTILNASFIAQLKGAKADILAHPKISAMDGQPAQIFIGDKIKYVESIQATPSGVTVTTGTVEAGIMLNCLGQINVNDGTVTLKIAPEVSTPTFVTDPQSHVTLPQIATRRAESVIRVKDGETIVIGGLINSTERETLTRIPFLSDLPFLGQLFRHRDKEKDKRELMIFITCTIMKDL